ncbi:Alpha/Beta hydrolase protein [Mycena capillaripes]|nr:Alpha/Beta hydrolase protein [Mycena capillaripes]
MAMSFLGHFSTPVSTTALARANTTSNNFDVKAFKIDLTDEIPRLKSLVKNSRVELDVLQELRTDWLIRFDWEAQQAELNHSSLLLLKDKLCIFLHEKSKSADAIPVILLHGWPGEFFCLPRSFYEFLPVIKPLTQSSGKEVSYNVVVPSLPGFIFSSAPPANWTVDDTARIFNTLMTEVLGYSTYAVHSTDWGSAVGYRLYGSFNTTVRAAHFVFLPLFPPSAQEIAENNITLSDIQNPLNGPNDVGLALYDNPVGQLAWIGGKFKQDSDPRAGTPPSVLDNTAILMSVSLYFLTESFLSSVWIYAQNPNSFSGRTRKPPRMHPYFHDFGGHWPGLDDPPALIEDIREMGLYFKP